MKTKMDGILSLKWNNHLTVLFNTLSSLYKKDLYSDVTLACGGRFFPVHKLVLSACSDFFEELFRQTPCTHPVVILKDVSVNDLEALLSYMYLGEANVAQSDLARLIKAAECLCIKGLAVPDEGGSDGASAKRRHASTDESTRKRRKSETTNPPAATASPAKSSTPPAPTEGEARVGGGGVGSNSSSSNSSGGGSNPPTRPTPPPAPPSPREDGVGALVAHTHATQNLAEVVLEDDDPIIKEEVELPDPKCEAEVEVEEVVLEEEGGRENHSDESLSRPGGSRMFASPGLNSNDGTGDGSSGDGGGGGVNLYDPQTQALAATHPNSGVLTDLMVSGIAGPSVPGDLGWESMGGFPLEALQSEDSRSSQPLGCASGGGNVTEVAMASISTGQPWGQEHSAGRTATTDRRNTGSTSHLGLAVRSDLTPTPAADSRRMRSFRHASRSAVDASFGTAATTSAVDSHVGGTTARNFAESHLGGAITRSSAPPSLTSVDVSLSLVNPSALDARVTITCEYCGKGFLHRSTFQRHLRAHTGERPFKCAHCSHATSRKHHLKLHILKHHGDLLPPSASDDDIFTIGAKPHSASTLSVLTATESDVIVGLPPPTLTPSPPPSQL